MIAASNTCVSKSAKVPEIFFSLNHQIAEFLNRGVDLTITVRLVFGDQLLVKTFFVQLLVKTLFVPFLT